MHKSVNYKRSLLRHEVSLAFSAIYCCVESGTLDSVGHLIKFKCNYFKLKLHLFLLNVLFIFVDALCPLFAFFSPGHSQRTFM